MGRCFLAFFTIALCAELSTTWAQRLRNVTDVAPGLYYPSFERLILERLLVWSIVFAVLSAIYALIVRRIRN